MQTSRNMTPHRVLPFVLAVPLSLLLFSARGAGTGESHGVFPENVAPGLSHGHPLPAPWGDDLMETGLPVQEPDGKKAVRMVPRVRILAPEKPVAALRGFHPGPAVFAPRILYSLAESLALGRPPPADSLPDGNGGNVGNDHMHQTIS